MPKAAYRPCSKPGCPNLVRDGSYCDVHKQERARAFQRDPKTQRLYDREWQRKRKLQLARHPWCQDCEEQGLFVEATDVHHEIRHQGDRKKFIESPLRSLCHTCHSRHTAVEVRGQGGVKSSGLGGVERQWPLIFQCTGLEDQ